MNNITEYENPIPAQFEGRNMIIVISSTGSYEEWELSDAQLAYIRECLWPFRKQ